ncbi:MAG: translation initiation factor IF-2 [Muribaculaceae bacterium]|jgi:translation initiation factor IF-2|nr:translation initiation factor IF-2 [Muribaculaceae bacterium]
MSVKISKVARDFNVGTQRIIEALSKKGITIDSNPNSRISDEQYEMLVKEFQPDKDQRIKSEEFINERQSQKEKSKSSARAATESEKAQKQPKVEEIKTEVEQMNRPKVLGKIDLAQVGKPAPKQTEKKPEPQQPKQQQQPKPQPQQQPKQPQKPQQPKPQPQQKPKPAHTEQKPAQKPVQSQPAPKPVQPEKPAQPVQPQKPQQPAVPAQPQKPAEPEIFSLGSPTLKTTLNVIGKIDLSTLNQQTRPKKKTKEEKRKERMAKAGQQKPNGGQQPQQGNGQQNANGERKKRKRIGKEKIDIEKSANQIQQNQNRQNNGGGNNGGQNNNNNNQNGGKRRDKKNKRPFKPEVNEEDVQKQVKETLARLTSKAPKKGAKFRKEKREAARESEIAEAKKEAAEEKTLKLTEFVSVQDLSAMMNVPVNEVIKTCMDVGVMVSINQRLDAETINIVAEEFGFKTKYVSAEVVQAIQEDEDKPEDLVSRPPVVTVMGHVDHGKTSLLDYIRKSNVIAGEAGGITQHIGAYNVKMSSGQRITFLDTPGHEAFTAMRARGAKVTDIVIIIVAADDSVMPQTIEAINHASAAGVPIIFAINKIDKPGANPEKIKEELANMNYLVEEWGGKYQSQDISAKKGIGVTELMDKVLLEAEMLDLKANPNRRATGTIIESSLDKGRGYVATVLVSNGTLHNGDIVLAGTHFGKVKAMFNERNKRIKEAAPAAPALILGLNGAPMAGDIFNVIDTEQEAREIANKREQLQRELGLRTQKRPTLEDIGRRKALGDFHELNLIVKGDVDGSIEALSDSLLKLSTPEVNVNVLHKAVGAISESDVSLAAASNAIIIGFQVRPSQQAKRLAEQEGVNIRLYSIIYDAIEEVKSAMEGMLSPELKEEILGSAEVQQTYHISKVGTIAGAIVREGKVKRNCKVRVIRDGIVKFTGELGSLKRFKDDAKEVTTGFDCGLSIVNFNDIQVGDMIESFDQVEVKKKL